MLLVAVAVLVGAVLQSATGFGFALVAGPALLAATAPDAALTTLVLLGLGLSLLLLATERRTPQVDATAAGALLLGAVPGEVLGALLLRVAPTAALQVVVGVLVLVTVALRLRAPAVARAAPSRRRRRAGSVAVGTLTGAVGTATGVSGPPVLLWLQRLGLAPAALRDTLAATFLGLAATTLVVYAGAGTLALPPGGAGTVVGLLVLVALGQRLGRRVFARLSPRAFGVAALVVVTGAGLASIHAGLTG